VSKHTKGPWLLMPEFSDENGTDYMLCSDDGEKLITSFTIARGQEDEANALLIASAPVMYDQIRKLREALERIAAIEDQMNGPDWEEIGQARDIARSALKETAE
jgi:hypothetical protein